MKEEWKKEDGKLGMGELVDVKVELIPSQRGCSGERQS